MDKKKRLEEYYNNENIEEKNNDDNETEAKIKRKERLEQYYDENKDLNDENVGSIYIGLVFADVILLNIMSVIGFGIFESLTNYDINWFLIIILWIIDVFVLASFLYSVKQTIKYLKKLWLLN